MADDKWMAAHRAVQVRGFARRWLNADVYGRKPGVIAVLRTSILDEAAGYRITEEEVMAAVAQMTGEVQQ